MSTVGGNSKRSQSYAPSDSLGTPQRREEPEEPMSYLEQFKYGHLSAKERRRRKAMEAWMDNHPWNPV